MGIFEFPFPTKRKYRSKKMNDLVVAGLGIGTVFTALICIIAICSLMGLIFKSMNSKENNDKARGGVANATEKASAASVTESAPAAIQPAAAEYVSASIPNRSEVVAAISAAISEYTGADISKIRILSIRERADSIPDRARLCAAISAVICEETGAEAVRIHSIRRTMQNRAELCAAISAVICEETGAEAVRIHSLKRV